MLWRKTAEEKVKEYGVGKSVVRESFAVMWQLLEGGGAEYAYPEKEQSSNEHLGVSKTVNLKLANF